MSSATLLFVLERVIQQSRPAPGDYGLLIGFGPGVTIELGLVQW
jgi:predicted naringenin-chalcone synthase